MPAMADTSPADAAIQLVNVTHHYGLRPVLRDVSISICRGETVALMGPNGMGKTTLMGIMAGMLAPARGQVFVNGQLRRSSEEVEIAIRNSLVYLPAEAWIPRHISGRKWLLCVARIWGLEPLRAMDHADRLFELFDLVPQQDAPVASYSTGQQKKLAIAGALITEAPILLLDEPFSGGLDPSGITALKRVLQRLGGERRSTIVMATPVPELVEELADRIAVVRQGQIVAFDDMAGLRRTSGCRGPLAEVYEKLYSPQTARNVENYFAAGRGSGAP